MSATHPAKIGKYEVECLLGEGAMGVVYRASDPLIGRRVAIKVMADSVAQDTSLRGRFLREAQAAGSLQHPNVVTIYDFGEVDDHLYIAMEYVEGDDVSELLEKKIAVSLDAIVELTVGVLHGLAYAHKRGIVHRDIKPANIRVDSEGKARLMDFGIAHLSSSEMTSTGVLLGTPSYMAPEQISGAPVTPQTDIFSVGAVLYELLTHSRPFKGDTLHSLMYQILSQPPRPIEEIAPEVPEPLRRIVMRALEKDPAQRYATAVEMANDLTRVRTTAIPGGRRGSVSLRATIDSALAGQQGMADAARQVPEAPRRSRKTALIAGSALAAAVVLVLAARSMAVRDGAPGPRATVAVPSSRVVPEVSSPQAAPPAARQAAAPAEARSSPAPREIARVLGVQRAALDARRRASELGATAAQLRVGDALNRAGESFIDSGRVVEAADAFSRAASAWSDGERAARRAAQLQQAVRVAEAGRAAPAVQREPEPAVTPPIAQPARSSAVTAEAPPPASAPSAAPEVRDNPAASIASVIAAYARALESREIAQLRRVYPAMSASQRRAFEDFFRATRSLQANLAVSSLRADGAEAEADVTGTYIYVTSAGASERQPVKFRASLRRDGAVWTLTAVH